MNLRQPGNSMPVKSGVHCLRMALGTALELVAFMTTTEPRLPTIRAATCVRTGPISIYRTIKGFCSDRGIQGEPEQGLLE